MREYSDVVSDVISLCEVKVILDYYGLSFRKNNNELLIRCVFHGKNRGKEDKNPSLSVNIDKKLYKCWSCSAKGNIVQLVMELEISIGGKDSCSFNDALIKICEICNIEMEGLFRVNKDKFNMNLSLDDLSDNKYTQEIFSDSALDKFYIRKNYSYFNAKGFTNETLDYFEMGFGIRGRDNYRCVFPCRNLTGRLVGWTGRTIKDNISPKWLHQPSDRFYTSQNLFNIDKALPYIIEERTVYVVESVGNCMRVAQSGKRNVVALLGNKISEFQINLLMNYADTINFIFDNDDGGITGMDIVCDSMYGKQVNINFGIYDFGYNLVKGKLKAKDLADVTDDMVDTIKYITIDEYIERQLGRRILTMSEIKEPTLLEMPDGMMVMVVDKKLDKCEYDQITTSDIIYMKQIDKLFGIKNVEVVPF